MKKQILLIMCGAVMNVCAQNDSIPIVISDTVSNISVNTLSIKHSVDSLEEQIPTNTSKHLWEQYMSDVMSPEDYTDEQLEQYYDLFCELEQQPLNINTATREQLEQFPFLATQTVEDISEYLYRYGPMKSLGELMMIRSLDFRERQLLRCFIVCEEPIKEQKLFPTLQELQQYSRHTLMATVQTPLYKLDDADKYRGYPVKHWFRYEMTYHDKLKAGIIGSQDTGEPFFSNTNRAGYDFYSYYIQLQNLGPVERIILGKFRISMGMGLVVNNTFGLGKAMMLQNLGRTANAITPHTSRTSYNHFQGIAATIRLTKYFKLSTFFSYNPTDATLNKDGTAATILTTGYHRTENEIDKKNNLAITTYGGSLNWHRNTYKLGLNIIATHLNRPLHPNTKQPYRLYYASGQDFLNTSITYSYTHPRWAVSGETAINKDGAWAMLNNVSFIPNDQWRLMLLQRAYSYRYSSLFANSFSDGGHIQNESGLYAGATYTPSLNWQLSGYVDYAYFPWKRYQVSDSSHSWDIQLQASHNRKQWQFDARYRYRWKQQDNSDKTALISRQEHRTRLSATYDGPVELRTQLDGGVITQNGGYSKGYMVSETAGYEWKTLKLNGGVGYFHTDDFNSRIYVYEQSPLYSYGFMQFSGRGWRYWLMGKLTLVKNLSLTLKFGTTRNRTDMTIQARWKF